MIVGSIENDIYGNVTCVIPAYNAEATVERAVSSVLAANGIKDIVVVDDGSVDATAQIVSQLAKQAKIAVHLYSQENAGPSAARNLGIQKATGNWVAFLDSDDEMCSSSIRSKIEWFTQCADSESISAVYGGFLTETGVEQSAFTSARHNVSPDSIGKRNGTPGGCPALIFRRRVLSAVGGLDVKLKACEDFDLILRILQRGERIVGNNEPSYVRYYTQGSLTRGNLAVTLKRERAFLRKAWRLKLMSRKETLRRIFINLARSGLKKN